MKPRLTYFVSHPIQYQAPLLRWINQDPFCQLKVIFERDFSSNDYFDRGFQTTIGWDVPLREGYESRLLAEVDVNAEIRSSDAIWLHGWGSHKLRKIIRRASEFGKPVLMRGENCSFAMPDGRGLRKLIKRRYLHQIFEQCSGFLTIGSKNREYYLDYDIQPDKLFDMPYAVDNIFFSSHATDEKVFALRSSLGISPKDKVILFAGKMTRRKNPYQLLNAWKILAKNLPKPPILIFVGDGKLRHALESDAPEGVIFVGFQNQTAIPAFYAAADLFVLVSEMEPWGLAINEAMACGTAVVASNQCGASYDLIDEDTGRMVGVGNQDALVEAISEVLTSSDRMGKAAQKKVFSWNFEADLMGLKRALGSVL